MKKLCKMIFLISLLYSLNANALIGSYTVKIIDVTNPAGAAIDSSVQDISERGGYSIYCDLTGSLQFTGSIYASNQKVVAPAAQSFTILSGTTAIMDNTGFMYDVVMSNVSYVKLRIGTFSGAGTAKCYLTTKDI